MNIHQQRGILLQDRLMLINEYISQHPKIPFDQYLQLAGVSKDAFVEGLPDKFQNPPAKDRKKVIAYATALNREYFSNYLQYQHSINQDSEGEYIDYLEGMNLPEYSEGVVREGDAYYASGKERRQARRARRADKHHKESKALHNLNKYDPIIVIARNAFRALLDLNMWHMSHKLNRMHEIDADNWGKIKVKWYNLGGDESHLLKSIAKGKDKATPKEKIKKKLHRADGDSSLFGGSTRVWNANAEVWDKNAEHWAVSGGTQYAINPNRDLFADGQNFSVAGETAGLVASAGAIVASVAPIIENYQKNHPKEQDPADTTGDTIPPDVASQDDGSNGKVAETLKHDTVVDPEGKTIAATPPKESFYSAHKTTILIAGSALTVSFIFGIIALVQHYKKA